MRTRDKKRTQIRPVSILPLGFLLMIAIGTVLLMLPAATRDGSRLPFLSALFTATSASCVTGLVVVDTGTFFSLFGQLVILVLIQLGGLGFMAVATILFVLIGKRISLRERLTLAEAFGETRLQGLVRLGITAVLVTLGIEMVGAALLAIRFVPLFGPWRGLYYAVFHAVSAFCNAGFDLMGGYASFTAYTSDALVNCVLMALVVTGGLGFTVLVNVWRTRRFVSLRLHSKIVLSATAALLLGGAILVFLFEYSNPATLGALPFGKKVLAAAFQSVTLRTAGFNTIDQAALTDGSKVIGCLLMLVGGAPAGTAGGLKITTCAVMLLAVRAEVRGRPDVEAFSRRISPAMVRRSLSLVVIGMLLFIIGITGVSVMEQAGAAGRLGFLNQAYEVISALCTVGLSTGVTGLAGTATRAILIVLMFTGRVGMLTVALSLTAGRGDARVRLPEEELLIG